MTKASYTDMRHAKFNADILREPGLVNTTTGSVAAAGGTLTVALDISPYNKGLIDLFHVQASASTDFDIDIFRKDTELLVDRIYNNIDNNLTLIDRPIRPIPYRDLDSTNELHIKITNNDVSNASTFTINVEFGGLDQ